MSDSQCVVNWGGSIPHTEDLWQLEELPAVLVCGNHQYTYESESVRKHFTWVYTEPHSTTPSDEPVNTEDGLIAKDGPVTQLIFPLIEPAIAVVSAICAYTYVDEDGDIRYAVREMCDSSPIEMLGLAGLAMQHVFHGLGE